MVADNDSEAGELAFRQLGFKRMTAEWRELVTDPMIGIVSITTPNIVHREMALAAIAAGKHVHCEKPIAPNAADAKAMMERRPRRPAS
jgi:predicted dehydrogenase